VKPRYEVRVAQLRGPATFPVFLSRFPTRLGATRKLTDERALAAAIDYVRRQANALLIWINPEYA
jgi:hypothetical protein